jgi:hypothetical protein
MRCGSTSRPALPSPPRRHRASTYEPSARSAPHPPATDHALITSPAVPNDERGCDAISCGQSRRQEVARRAVLRRSSSSRGCRRFILQSSEPLRSSSCKARSPSTESCIPVSGAPFPLSPASRGTGDSPPTYEPAFLHAFSPDREADVPPAPANASVRPPARSPLGAPFVPGKFPTNPGGLVE